MRSKMKGDLSNPFTSLFTLSKPKNTCHIHKLWLVVAFRMILQFSFLFPKLPCHAMGQFFHSQMHVINISKQIWEGFSFIDLHLFQDVLSHQNRSSHQCEHFLILGSRFDWLAVLLLRRPHYCCMELHGVGYLWLCVLCGSGKKAARNNEEEWSWIDEKMGRTAADVWEMDKTE